MKPIVKKVRTCLESLQQTLITQERALTLPGLLWILFFFLLPAFILLDFSFREKTEGAISTYYTLSTYKKVFLSSYNHLVFKSIYISALATIITIALALPVSFHLGRASKRLRRMALIAISVPFWTSFLVRIFAWKTLLHPEGFLKMILTYIHLVRPETILLYNDQAVLTVIVYTSLPFALFPLIASVEKFDWALIEAAQDMGATPIKALRSVFFPSLKPALFAAAFMIFIPNLGAYVIPELIGGANGYLIGSRILHHSLIAQDLPTASALSIVLTFVALIGIALALWLSSIFSGGTQMALMDEERSSL